MYRIVFFLRRNDMFLASGVRLIRSSGFLRTLLGPGDGGELVVLAPGSLPSCAVLVCGHGCEVPSRRAVGVESRIASSGSFIRLVALQRTVDPLVPVEERLDSRRGNGDHRDESFAEGPRAGCGQRIDVSKGENET